MLTDSKINSARKKDKPYRLGDGQGLYLHVATSGTKTWRIRYFLNGKESQIVVGHYPDISLAEARLLLMDIKKLVREGKNPQVHKILKQETKAEQRALIFEKVAREWLDTKANIWTERHYQDVLRSLERDIFPSFGNVSILELTPRFILQVLKKIESRGAVETAHRLRQRINEIFKYSISNDYCKDNPAITLSAAMQPIIKSRQPAIIDLDEAIIMLKKADDVPAFPITKLALRFLLLTVVRPGELRFARWEEMENLDGDNPVWRIPNSRMKMKRDHIVPLCPMAVEVLKTAYSFSGHLEYVFPNSRFGKRAMSENALGYLLNRAGYYQRHVPHGFRAMFSSLMNEHFPQDRSVIDLVLAHLPKDKVEGAYNRTTHFDRRKVLMVEWEKIITGLLKPVKELVVGVRR